VNVLRIFACVAALAVSSHATAQGIDLAKAKEGEQVYENNCLTCHGEKLQSNGQIFDLRTLKASERDRFDRTVRNGKGQMPPWAGVLSDEEIDQVWHFIRQHAEDR
jgi:mono/diheme cytochrome c family protein